MKNEDIKKFVAASSVVILAGILILTVTSGPLSFGSFPVRKVGETFRTESIGLKILKKAPEEVGGANVVTDVLWDYRGYDTLGEATVIFTAVAAVAVLFRETK